MKNYKKKMAKNFKIIRTKIIFYQLKLSKLILFVYKPLSDSQHEKI